MGSLQVEVLGPEGPSVRKRTVRNRNTDGIPSVLARERPSLFRPRRELAVFCVQSWRATGIGRDVVAAAGVLHATNRGPNAGVHFACNTHATDQSRPSIPCQIDGVVRHPARPPTLRASRYRTFSHGWAFRPYWARHLIEWAVRPRRVRSGVSDSPVRYARRISSSSSSTQGRPHPLL